MMGRSMCRHSIWTAGVKSGTPIGVRSPDFGLFSFFVKPFAGFVFRVALVKYPDMQKV